MKKIAITILGALLVGIMFCSCGPNDQKLQENVQTALRNSYPQVSSSVNKKVVTLTGTVNSQQAKNAAEQVARNVNNVKSVTNNIVVSTPAPTPAVATNSDDVIRTNLTSSLRSGGYNNVNVNVQNGEITLTGDVRRADLQKVMQLANETNPKKVNNQLTIR